jgi:hypothetical protein
MGLAQEAPKPNGIHREKEKERQRNHGQPGYDEAVS